LKRRVFQRVPLDRERFATTKPLLCDA
jgi:hypothetical protein